MAELKYWKRQAPKAVSEDISENIVQIPTDTIRPNRSQPRANFDNNSMIRLADSIRRYGILQPLSVRRAENDDSYDYELVAGERRLRAAKMLGLFTVPCIILQVDEKTSAELAIIENLLREDLDMFEQALSFRRLIDDYGMTQEELARKMSMSQSSVANKLRLLKLTYPEQQKILEASLSERHARALLKLDDPATRLDLIAKIIDLHLTVQGTEELIERILAGAFAKDSTTSAPDSANDPIAKAFREEKEIEDWVKGVKKKIDLLTKNGKSASMDIQNRRNEVLVTICIKK